MKKTRTVFALLSIAWMIVIFIFSSRTAEVSSRDSAGIGRILCEFFISGFENMDQAVQTEIISGIDFAVRKTAHAVEYAVLGFLLYPIFYRKTGKKIPTLLFPWLIAVLYAASDEFHQLFVDGRAGRISDVILDSTGAAAGIITSFLFVAVSFKLINAYKIKKMLG